MATRTALLLAICFFATPIAFAADAKLPSPAEIQSLSVHPTSVKLASGDDAAQLVVTATLKNGRLRDVTEIVAYSLKDANLATISPSGRILPRANGASEVAITYGPHRAAVPISAEHVGENLPLNFTNQIIPVFTKLGCNSGGCHGKQSGQNGFRLSLLGFEPELDFMTLLKESRGRRLFPANPDRSLFLLKGIGAVPHGGGKKLEPGSDEYKLIRRWIAAGMPWGSEDDPTVTHLSVFPEHRILERQAPQQVAVYAHYSDGSVEDITRRAQYETNDPEVAKVGETGLINTQAISGEAAIMARYQSRIAVVRVTVPHQNHQAGNWKFEPKTLVDQHTAKKWKDLGLVPSELCTDEQFLRRAYLDITGTLPTAPQVLEFLKDTRANKRDLLVDRLLETPEYSFYFANKWADILRVRRRNQQERAAGTFAFHEWIRSAVAADMPYSEFVRAIITASGDENRTPPTVWYKEMEKPENFVDDVAQVFLGQRLACANCHHHPYEKWGQDDYWSMAAFFGRVARKTVSTPTFDGNGDRRSQIVYSRPGPTVTNKRTNKTAEFKPLDASPMTIANELDPREKLAEWMIDPKNPFFAKTIANRYWAHFLGRGIVDPLDDMRVTNPPSNPELLDALTKSVVDSQFRLKELIRTICKSRTYQLSSVPNEGNRDDRQAFARYYPKRLSAEVLFDAVCQVTNSPASFGSLPRDRFAPARAIQLPDESFTSYFLEVFGKPQRISACECERVSEANLAQSLHMLNSDDIQNRASRGDGRADQLAKDARPDAEKVEELFLWVLGRKPTANDTKFALAHIEKVVASKGSKKQAYENLVWALMNTKEFAFNQ